MSSGDHIREFCDRSRTRSGKKILSKLLSNDPETTSVEVWNLNGCGCGPALGQALTNNTHVSSIDIAIGCLLLPGDVDTAGTTLARFLEFLRKSPSLRHVTLQQKHSSRRNSWIHLIFTALAQNSNILSLHLEYVDTALEECTHFLRTTTSLKRLWMGSNTIPVQQAQLFVNAFNANQTLEELGLAEYPKTMDLILDGIGCHRLRSLALQDSIYRIPCERLSNVLCTTTVLEELTLDSYEICMEEMTLLQAALASNSSVTKLRLHSYRLPGRASSMFARFVRHECNQDSNKIREIHLEPRLFVNSEMNPAKLLPSSVDVLSIKESHQSGVSRMTQFFRKLPKDPFTCKIPCLRISLSESDGINAMIRYLPTSTILRKLVVFGSEQGFLYTPNFRRALRRNGSLCSLTIEHDDGAASGDHTMLLILQAFCQRNQAVQDMIEFIDSQPCPGLLRLTRLPSLLYVAQKAPRTAPNAILKILLICDSIGCGSSSRAFRMKRQRDAS
jgi:hypothetical protein